MKPILCLVVLMVMISHLRGGDEVVRLSDLPVEWQKSLEISSMNTEQKIALGNLLTSWRKHFLEIGIAQGKREALEAAVKAKNKQTSSCGTHWISAIKGSKMPEQIALEDGSIWNVAPYGGERAIELKKGTEVFVAISDAPSYPNVILNGAPQSFGVKTYCYITPVN